MKVRFYCGMTTGPARANGWEPECSGSGEIDVPATEWVEGFVSHTCPDCGAKLEQGNDHFEEATA